MPNLVEGVRRITTSGTGIVFAGAGVGARVGLPTWQTYLESLAQALNEHGDELASRLLLQRLSDRDYIGAATVYTTSTRIPKGEQQRRLVAPLTANINDTLLERLEPLVKLPVQGIVTPNFDNSLHRAFALIRRQLPIAIERDDGGLAHLAFSREFFIGRIHGRAERPDSLVLDAQQFAAIANDPIYRDCLLNVLKNKACLFIGFSFEDPAIAHILSQYEQIVPAIHRPLHCALVPGGSSALAARLRGLNVEVVSYDDRDDHKALWSGIRDAYESINSPDAEVASYIGRPGNQSATRRYFAFAYTQLDMRGATEPLLDMARDGIVLDAVPRRPGRKSKAAVIQAVREALSLNEQEAATVTAESLIRLSTRNELSIDGDSIQRVNPVSPIVAQHFERLITGVCNRMFVRSGITAFTDDRTIISEALENTLISRAWDLGAHFCGAPGGLSADLPSAINAIVGRAALRRPNAHKDEVADALRDLLAAPDNTESELLAELGRCAFSLQLVLSSPRQTLLHEHVLPQRLYLDANVLMPAIIPGHPIGDQYVRSIARLREATNRSGAVCAVVAAAQFLNEIVSHRRLAFELARELELETKDTLRRHILFHGALGTNAYISAYAATVLGGRAMTFRDFMNEAAPYESELLLRRYLEQRGIGVEDLQYRRTANHLYTPMLYSLQSNYEDDHGVLQKEKVLIDHEAEQLTALRHQADAGVRVLFVTADLRLLRIIQKEAQLADVAGMCISQLGFVNLVDLFLGGAADNRALARLMWGMPRTNDENMMRDYLVSQALTAYQTSFAVEMPQIVRQVAADVAYKAAQQELPLKDVSSVKVAAASKRLLDTYEAEYFEKLRVAIERSQAVNRTSEASEEPGKSAP